MTDAVGPHQLPCAFGAPRPALRAGESRELAGIVRSALAGRAKACASGRKRQHLDDAAERVGTIKIAGRAANNLDTIHGRLRHAVPGTPSFRTDR